jgi:hypothetical protein
MRKNKFGLQPLKRLFFFSENFGKKIPQKAGVFELGACETLCNKLISKNRIFILFTKLL